MWRSGFLLEITTPLATLRIPRYNLPSRPSWIGRPPRELKSRHGIFANTIRPPSAVLKTCSVLTWMHFSGGDNGVVLLFFIIRLSASRRSNLIRIVSNEGLLRGGVKLRKKTTNFIRTSYDDPVGTWKRCWSRLNDGYMSFEVKFRHLTVGGHLNLISLRLLWYKQR